MQVQQTYKENINDANTTEPSKGFFSKTMSRKSCGLTDEWWTMLDIKESVEILIIDDNKLTILPAETLRRCFPNLKILSMKNNQLKKVSIEALAHPLLEVLDLEGNASLNKLVMEECDQREESKEDEGRAANNIEEHDALPRLGVMNLLGTQVSYIHVSFFKSIPHLNRLWMNATNLCGGCGFEFLGHFLLLEHLKITGVSTSSCDKCKSEKAMAGFSTAVKNSIYNMVCKMITLTELDLSGKDMNIDYFVFHLPLANLATLRMQGRLVRDMSLRDWAGILKTLKHLSLGVIDDLEDLNAQKISNDSTFYAERILEATNLESLSFDCETSRRIKFSLGTKKIIFPFLKHLTIKNCDLRPLTFFNRENAPLLDSLEIISASFTEGYFYTIKKRLGNRLRSLRIGIEKMDAPQAIYDLFTFIRSHKDLEILHLTVCDTITESQSFYKYFSDRPNLKELYVIGKMNTHRMKRFLYQLGHCSTLNTLLLDIEAPSVVLSYFTPIKNLAMLSLKSTFTSSIDQTLPISKADLSKIQEMKNLVVLDLSFCKLEEFPAEILMPLKHLGYLYLNNNQLPSLPSELIAYLASKKDTVMHIDVSCNNLDPDEVETLLINGTWLGQSGFILY
ncbi:hypothetical protein NEOKW01_2112 [Nematocida sp. AWRm80]|nr:hypothetical protein NEOKW01_2112 [Nematocida sp. AWRm80]